MYITREEAITTLYDVINSGIISDELEGKLQDIASCIDNLGEIQNQGRGIILFTNHFADVRRMVFYCPECGLNIQF